MADVSTESPWRCVKCGYELTSIDGFQPALHYWCPRCNHETTGPCEDTVEDKYLLGDDARLALNLLDGDLRDAWAEIETVKTWLCDWDEDTHSVEELVKKVCGLLKHRLDDLVEARAKIARKDKALEFYGDEANHERPKRLRSAAFACLSEVYGDKGAIARAALKPAGEETDSG